jgi:hypothetical protein
MVFKDVKKGIAALFSMIVLGFSVTGCGGGGSSSVADNAPEESLRVVIDESNSEQAISTVFNVIEVGSNPTLPLAKSVGETSVSTTVLAQPAAVKQIQAAALVRSDAVAGEPISCTNGGSITYSDTGMIFSNCNEAGLTMDGTVTVSGNETAGTMTLSNFTMTLDGEIVFYESLTFSFTLNAALEINSMSITMDGYTSIFGERTDYKNYTFTMTMDNLNAITFSINGLIKTDCLGGWIEIRTTENIQINYIDPCPTTGQIVIGGNASSITIDFNSDGSVNVSGSVTDYYPSCESLPVDSCNLI